MAPLYLDGGLKQGMEDPLAQEPAVGAKRRCPSLAQEGNRQGGRLLQTMSCGSAVGRGGSEG